MINDLEVAWSRLGEFAAALTEAEWAAPTECPGWTVKDNLAHVTGLEHRLLGRPVPDHPVAGAGSFPNQLAEWNAVDVDWRRPWPASRVLAEFEEVTGARLEQLRHFGDADFERESWTPAGPGTVRDVLPFRILDAWVHDQDMRRALRRPGHQDGPVAERTLGRLAAGVPFVVGKRVSPPDGTTVVLDIQGPLSRRLTIAVEGGRAKLTAEEPAGPSAVLRLDQDSFVRLPCGRGDPEEIAGRVHIAGDESLGRMVLRHMNFMP